MNASMDRLLTRYETGTLTRRELIAAIGLVAMPRKTQAQNDMFRARTLHHVNIGVADVSRSEEGPRCGGWLLFCLTTSLRESSLYVPLVGQTT